MNPQFCPSFHMRPKLLPVVIRPTVPVGYRQPFDPPPGQYNFPLFPIHLTPDASFSPTTSKTRRDLEQLGSPTEDVTKMIFQLAAQKNGIRIGTDHNKAVGTAKQSDSLEDFKKIAERNGITVCPAGSKDKVGTSSACSSENCSTVTTTSHDIRGIGVTSVSTTMPQDGLSRSPSSAINDWENACSDKCVAETQNACETQGNLCQFEAEVEKEMNSNLSIVDLFKNKAAMSGIRVQDTSDSVQIQSDSCTTKPFHALGSDTLAVCDSEPKIENLKTETFETRMGEIPSEHDSQSLDFKKGARRYGIDEVCARVTTSESALATEHVSMVTSSLIEDAQIKAFQEIAHLKGIKVGDIANETCAASNSCKGQVPGYLEAENEADAVDFTEKDVQVAKFQEMARLNGIKVGERNTGELSGDPCLEQIESVMSEIACDSDYYTDINTYMYPFEQDPQIAMFQEIARLKGIKVSESRSSSYSSISPANSEDHLCTLGNGQNPIVMHFVDTKEGVFEELAKRHGIKVGKSNAAPSETPISSVTDCRSLPLFSTISSHASTQTQVTVMVDCYSQTSEKDRGILKQATGVQVSVTKEAFEEEFLLWKLDDNALGDKEELCYKELYIDEKKMWEELSASLHNEKDMSANARHNHKRVMDQLKEELSGKSEEAEKLKKDLKTLKKHKETEIKRISKELKSREEELESTNTTLQLKEVALEGLRSIAHEQTAKIKALEEQLEEMKTMFMEAHKNEECKTCLKRNAEAKEETGIKDNSQEEQSVNGWTVFTGRKSKSSPYKPAQNTKVQGVQQHRSVDQLCDIDLTSPPGLYRQCVDEKSSICNKQHSSRIDVTIEAGSSEPLENDNVMGGAKSPISVTPIQGENVTAEEPSVLSKLGEEPPSSQTAVDNEHINSVSQNHPQNGADLANSNSQKPSVATGTSSQQPPHAFCPPSFTGQSSPFPAVPPGLLSQYLSSMQLLQQSLPSGNGLSKSSVLLRRPPGLSTEPVPEEEVPEQSAASPHPSTGKFSSFDRLMEALYKRFPSKNKQELIVYLKKAKAVFGSAGFRGKQMPDVVICVQDMVELEEKQESQDMQASPTDN